MLVKIETTRCLESLRQVANAIDSYGFNAWRRALDESKQSMHQHGYQNKSGLLTSTMVAKATQGRQFGWAGDITISAFYAQWVDQGTGIYGPHNTPIVPTSKPFLVFFWDKSGRTEFRRSVKGMPPSKFSKAAIDHFVAVAHAYIQAAVDSAVSR